MKFDNVFLTIERRFGFRYPDLNGQFRQKRPKETNEYLSTYGISHKKSERREETARILAKDPNYKVFIGWMDDIRRKLGETDDEFARRFGLKSGKMIARYRRGTGNLPTEATLKELLRLERIANVRISRK